MKVDIYDNLKNYEENDRLGVSTIGYLEGPTKNFETLKVD